MLNISFIKIFRIPLLPPTCFFSLKEIKGLRTLIEDYYLIMEQHVLSYIPPILSGKIQLLTPV